MIKRIIHSYGMPAALAILIALSSRNYQEKVRSTSEEVQTIHTKNIKVALTDADIINKGDKGFEK